MTSTTIACITVRFSQPWTYTRLNQMLTNLLLPELQQYGRSDLTFLIA